MNRQIKAGINILILIMIPTIMLAITFFFRPDRVSLTNMGSLIAQAETLSILALGLIFQTAAGTMDLSVGAVYIFTCVMAGNIVVKLDIGLPGLAIISVAIGLLCGMVSGLLFKLLKIPSFIISISMLLIFECLSCNIFGGRGVSLPSGMAVIINSPWCYIVPVLPFAIAFFLYSKTPIGIRAKAVGFHIKVAEMSGINPFTIKAVCFAIVGGFTGYYAFVQLGRVGYILGMQNMSSMPVVFDAMMCTHLAIATALYVSPIVSVFFCAIILQVTKYCLLILGLDSSFQSIAVGILVLIILGVLSNQERMSAFTERLKIRRLSHQL